MTINEIKLEQCRKDKAALEQLEKELEQKIINEIPEVGSVYQLPYGVYYMVTNPATDNYGLIQLPTGRGYLLNGNKTSLKKIKSVLDSNKAVYAGKLTDNFVRKLIFE